MKVSTPFAHYVPTEIGDNLRWRRRVFKRVLEDPSFADTIRSACEMDPIFYINGFLWTYDSRLVKQNQSPRVPFILYPFQRTGILEIFDAIGEEDLLIEKSRDMGASWLNVTAFQYLWLFRKLMSFLVVSRDAYYVDAPDNPKSLFWKIDFINGNLPLWLMPKGYIHRLHRLKSHIKNPENGSVIDGEATTDQVARGDRRTAILLDEFAAVSQGHKVLAATRDATNSRLFNSTPQGINNAYYTVRQTGIRRLRFFWTDHPVKSKGLYRITKDGKLDIIDKEGYPEDYKPVYEPGPNRNWDFRSPWLDKQDRRAATYQEIAQEVMIDYLGSGHQFFLSEAITEAKEKFARPPDLIGSLDYDSMTSEPSEFMENSNGHLKLWTQLTSSRGITDDFKYVLGCDISAGTGSSISTGCAYNKTTNEKIAEYANPYIRPEEFARQMVALATWLNNALLLWESNGVGQQFGARVMDLNYANIYYRKREEQISQKETLSPGWHSIKTTKLVLLGDYRDNLQRQKVFNFSDVALDECLEYVYNSLGGVEHSKEGSKNEDPTGARENHGDRVIADALAWRGLTEFKSSTEGSESEIPIGSLAWRIEQRRREEQREDRELSFSDGW